MFKYLISDSNDPYENLASEEALFRTCSKGEIFLFLWQNDNAIVIGRNQNPKVECLLDDFLAYGGKIARRRSGGGAVYHDLGTLCFSIIGTEIDYRPIIATVLEKFNIKAEHNARNDFIIDGKKISGNASYTESYRTCQHGTLLVSTDIKIMERFLTPNREKLERNYVSSVSSRVINLNTINPEITIEKLQESFIAVTQAVELNEKPRGNSAFYRSLDWIYGGIQ